MIRDSKLIIVVHSNKSSSKRNRSRFLCERLHNYFQLVRDARSIIHPKSIAIIDEFVLVSLEFHLFKESWGTFNYKIALVQI
jgi:hypothetical protein